MKKQQKIEHFMKLTTTQHEEIFQNDDLDFDNYEPNKESKLPNAKKEVHLTTFLNKFDVQTIEIIQKYVTDNKSKFALPTPTKISIFEDAVIIHQFLKQRQNILHDKKNTVEILCTRLQGLLKRAKITIRQRMCKKLCRCSIQQILLALKNNRNLTFEKKCEKSKKPPISVGQIHGDQMHTPVKTDSYSRRHSKTNRTEIKEETRSNWDKFSDDPIEDLNSRVENWLHPDSSKKRIYKYGTKQIKEKIYIYASKDSKQTIKFFESKLGEMKKMCSKEPQAKLFGFNTPPKNKQHIKQEDISSESSIAKHKNEIEAIQTKSSKLNTENNAQKAQQCQALKQSLQKQVLFQLNNNKDYLEIIKQNKNSHLDYVWSEEEDHTLYSFKFNPKAYTDDLLCLMRYKSDDMIIERMKFLNIDTTNIDLNDIRNEEKKAKQQHPWEIL